MHRSQFGFSATLISKVVAELSGVYRFTTLSMKIMVAVITAAMRWLSVTMLPKKS